MEINLEQVYLLFLEKKRHLIASTIKQILRHEIISYMLIAMYLLEFRNTSTKDYHQRRLSGRGAHGKICEH